MTSLYDPMVRFFEADGWYHKAFTNIQALRLPFKGAAGEWACIAQVRDEPRLFIFYSICPVKAATERREAIGEFITLANLGMPIGNFELDPSDGEIRFRTSIGLGSLEWSDELARVMTYTNVLSMDQYLTGLLRVLDGSMTARAAIETSEMSTSPVVADSGQSRDTDG